MRAALLLALTVFSVAACQIDRPPSSGHVSGLVGGWPDAPQGGGIAPEPNKTVEFHAVVNSSVHSVQSDSNGRYDIDLAPGAYEVKLAGFQVWSMLYARDPKTYGQWPRITVVASNTSRLDLIYDTMVR